MYKICPILQDEATHFGQLLPFLSSDKWAKPPERNECTMSKKQAAAAAESQIVAEAAAKPPVVKESEADKQRRLIAEGKAKAAAIDLSVLKQRAERKSRGFIWVYGIQFRHFDRRSDAEDHRRKQDGKGEIVRVGRYTSMSACAVVGACELAALTGDSLWDILKLLNVALPSKNARAVLVAYAKKCYDGVNSYRRKLGKSEYDGLYTLLATLSDAVDGLEFDDGPDADELNSELAGLND